MNRCADHRCVSSRTYARSPTKITLTPTQTDHAITPRIAPSTSSQQHLRTSTYLLASLLSIPIRLAQTAQQVSRGDEEFIGHLRLLAGRLAPVSGDRHGQLY